MKHPHCYGRVRTVPDQRITALQGLLAILGGSALALAFMWAVCYVFMPA